MPQPDFSAELARLDEAGLRRRRRVVESPQAPRLTADGCDWLSFCSNDYLGLANHPRLIEATVIATRRYGVGSGASPLVNGHHLLHEQLEQRLAAFMGRPCLSFSGGFPANVGILPALVGREDAIFADKLVHASIIDGAQLSRAKLQRFHHNDPAHIA